MQRNFDLVLSDLAQAMSSMIKALRVAIRESTSGTLPNEKGLDYRYPTFEIFSFLLAQLYILLVAYQDERIRRPLLDYVVGKMAGKLGIKEMRFYKPLNRRIVEYAGINDDKSKHEKLSQCFVEYLTHAILENDIFDWEGEVKPVPVLDAIRLFEVTLIYRELLSPIETVFLTILVCLFEQNPDITNLTKKEIRNAERDAMIKLKAVGLQN